MKYSNFDGLNGPMRSNLRPGDLAKNYLGDNQPSSVNRSLDEGAYEPETPEHLLIWKERWETVREIISDNPKTAPFLECLLDHFSGYSFEEIGDRHGISRQVAFHRIKEMVEYLRKKILGKQF